ncbi:hypothetical protein AbraIFM66951_006025 [Aspergillus brasiliensis]|uniref:Zn(2)-C6 fungal-type domain-containing protein n=1 Tax=Aspergillus brasiliensis TaxID=319629 RepID=A0A9W5YKC3_9EURO|nr:hypothetical protein AbraCBS73388_006059 [Aspergillus brasiliensis]GKZ44185.1 hypothetical protein AbraIFM66951_006025 [Aspergillus brasiliensis]
MVYGGKPSTGCHLCRKRKIKCDEGLPGCRNCAIYGQPCPGYRSDGIFRNETHKVQQLVNGKANGCASSSSRMQPSKSVSSSGGKDLQKLPLPAYRITDSTWEERAICYFFDQFTIVACNDEDSAGHLGFLPSLYAVCRDQNDPASSSLRLAVDATALMALSNRVQVPGIVTQARYGFGLALRRLQEALNLPVEAAKDETFATLVILSLFEDISGDRHGLTSAHTAGFEALTRLRGESQLGNARGLDMFKYAYVHMQVEFLLLKGKPSLDSDRLVERLDSANPLQYLMILASKIRQLVAEPSSASDSLQSAGITKLASWIDSCRSLDFELVKWSQSLPDIWLPLETRSYTGEDVLTYREMITAVIWAHYRVLRIFLYNAMTDLFRALVSMVESPGIQREASQHEADGLRLSLDLISDSCRSVPFCFGEIDILGNPMPPSEQGGMSRVRAFYLYSMLWPLWYILSCGLATPEQTQIIRGVMARTGSEAGIKLATMLASYGGQDSMAKMPQLYSLEQSVREVSVM